MPMVGGHLYRPCQEGAEDAGGTVALVLVARVRFALAFLLILGISFEWARLANVAL